MFILPVMEDHLSWKTTKFSGHFIQVSLYNTVIQSDMMSGVVTEVLIIIFSVGNVSHFDKLLLRSFESRSYLTGVTAAELRWHLSNMNVISNQSRKFG